VSGWPRCLRQPPALQAPDKRVTFARPFVLKGLDGVQPSGTYRVEAGARRAGFLSLLMGYRTTKSRWGFGNLGAVGVLRPDNIDPLDLAVVLIRDALAAEAARTRVPADETE
jgi:hypothetical protein